MSTLQTEQPPSISSEALLTTTRCVRKRLDLARPVAREAIERCVDIALQAPTGSYSQIARFICVDDPTLRAALGDLYRRGWQVYEQTPLYAGNMRSATPSSCGRCPGRSARRSTWWSTCTRPPSW